ncbi:MAG: hypothetical protein GXP17_03760 [Gammaproteobacteria bacterium]|nr:hypothetical protein [Gammaproteobacteria bacterium]
MIQHQVDQLLLEQGEYLPLEFLLGEGRLIYADYEAWRNGGLDTLAEALFGDPEHIQQQLIQAEDYLQRRGWQAETISYPAWGDTVARPLCFSANRTLNLCFHRRYHKPQDQPQMDLFTDSPATSLVNDITRALINRNGAEARRQLENLYDTAPDYARLGELERLVEAAENLDTPVTDTAAELKTLQESLTPLAETLLGKDSRNLLIPQWRRLSSALHDHPYQATHPELHRSYTASQAMDWEAVRQAVEQHNQWQAEPLLLLRHARACEQLHLQSEALLSWCNLCWQFPEQCDALESSNDHPLRRHWITFQELEPELPTSAFPAWLYIAGNPGLTRQLPEPGNNPSACPASYDTLRQLQNPDQTNDNIALRARLKQQAPTLFHYFLDNIGSPS